LGAGHGTLRELAKWGARESLKLWPLATVIILAICVQVATGMTIPIGLKFILDDVVPSGKLPRLYATIGAMGVAAMLFLGSRLLQDWALATLGAKILTRMRTAFFDRLQSHALQIIARRGESDILSRFGADLRELELTMTLALPGLLRQLLKIVANGAILFFIDWRMALGVTIILALVFVAPRRLLARAHAVEAKRQEAAANVLEVVQENIATHRVVRAFLLQFHRRRIFDDAVRGLERDSIRSGLLSALLSRLAGTAITLVQVGALGVGAWLVIEGELTLGLLVAFVGLLTNVAGAGQAAMDVLPIATRGAGNLARVRALMDVEDDLDDADGGELGPLEGDIVISNASFSYVHETQVLEGIDLRISAGEYVAIVGPSGSGKTTLLALITRVRPPTTGTITVDGRDLRTVTEASLRRQIAPVLQEPALFDTSIRANIRVGKLDATDEEIETAARAADADGFIKRLPSAYDTPVGPRGSALSGGQRQRIAIARALVREPRLLILDEATSALDPATEHAIGETLEKARVGRTVISVTHRLRTVVDCDRIFVFEEGRLAEQGTHAELLALDGTYREMWEKQGGITVSPSGHDATVTPERLRRIKFLSALDSSHLEELAEAMVPERFAAGESIFEEGDYGDRFYLLARGSVEALNHDASGVEQVLTVMDDGDVFGEIAIVEHSPRTATIRAREPSLCLSISRDVFEKLLSDVPELRATVARTISQRLARSAEVRASFSSIE